MQATNVFYILLCSLYIQFSSVTQSCPTLYDPMNRSTPGLPVHHQLPEFTQTHVHRVGTVMPSSHLILCCPLLLLPPIPPSIRVFSNESTFRMGWPKYCSFSFSISPSKEHPGLISFRMDWLDLLAVQGTLKSLLQHNSSKASILQCSAFFTVQLSHPYMTTGKVQAGFRKGRGTRDQIANIHWIMEKAREFQKHIYFCFTKPKPLTVWITINCGKFFKRWEYQTTWPASWEICMQVRKQQLELDMEQQTGSK